MTTTTQPTLPKSLQWAPRPAPFIPGLFSMQHTHCDAHKPFVAVYRQTAKDAEQWMREERHYPDSTFFLRNAEQDVDLYDYRGKIVKKFPAPAFAAVAESEDYLLTDKTWMLQEARTATGNPQLALLVSAEDHAGASAADHSNFVIVCRRMIIEAKTPDLQHVYIVESQRWPCRVTGIYADISALSPALQDVYLERFRWLSNSWPLNPRHHIHMLADRLVRVRSRYVTNLLLDCGHAANMSHEMILTLQSKWMHASPGSKYRFAQHLVETLREGLLFEINQAEVFAPTIIDSHGAVAIKDFRSFLG